MTTTWTKQIGLSLLIAPLLLGTAQAAETPPSFSDPTYIVVGYQPGGASDRAARFVAEQLQKNSMFPSLWKIKPELVVVLLLNMLNHNLNPKIP